MGRPSMDLVRLQVRIRRQDAEDLEAFYPSFGSRSNVIRALVAKHVRKLNARVGKRVGMAVDEAEAHLLPEETVNDGTTSSTDPATVPGPESDGHGES